MVQASQSWTSLAVGVAVPACPANPTGYQRLQTASWALLRQHQAALMQRVLNVQVEC